MSFSTYRDVVGSSQELAEVGTSASADPSPDVPGVWLVAPDDDLPDGLTWDGLRSAGFDGTPKSMITVPSTPAVVVLAGIGSAPGTDHYRDAAGLGSRALSPHREITLHLPDSATQADIQAAVEGTLLARYRYDALRADPQGHRLERVTVSGPDDVDAADSAARLGSVYAAATALTRDLANSPHNHLTATRLADLAADLGAAAGLEVEIYDQQRIESDGLGALLAVNAGSKEEARVVRLHYSPSGDSTGHLALIGKGVMYDSGGIGLKPNNDSHAQMKNDMTGAAAILAAMLALPTTGGSAEVTGYLMCTDNMPSASATALGDVCRGRSGRTIEIVDTDAEGRLILSDGISLAVEDGVDAIVDIATLTGSVARAFGPLLSGLAGSSEDLVEAIGAAGQAEGEPTARIPLEHAYREHIDSPVADLRNVGPMGVPDGIIAALFLHSFTADKPWAHLDIAGSAWTSTDAGWRTPGCTGTGARTLLAFASRYRSTSGNR